MTSRHDFRIAQLDTDETAAILDAIKAEGGNWVLFFGPKGASPLALQAAKLQADAGVEPEPAPPGVEPLSDDERAMWTTVYTHFLTNDRRENADGSTTYYKPAGMADDAVWELRARCSGAVPILKHVAI